MHDFSNNPSRTRSQRVAVEISESNIPAQFAHVGSCTEKLLPTIRAQVTCLLCSLKQLFWQSNVRISSLPSAQGHNTFFVTYGCYNTAHRDRLKFELWR